MGVALIFFRTTGVVVFALVITVGAGIEFEEGFPIKGGATSALDESDETYEKKDDSEHRLGYGEWIEALRCFILEDGMY